MVYLEPKQSLGYQQHSSWLLLYTRRHSFWLLLYVHDNSIIQTFSYSFAYTLWLHIYMAHSSLLPLLNPLAPLAVPFAPPLYPFPLTWHPPAVTGIVLLRLRLLVNWPYLPHPSPNCPTLSNFPNPNCPAPIQRRPWDHSALAMRNMYPVCRLSSLCFYRSDHICNIQYYAVPIVSGPLWSMVRYTTLFVYCNCTYFLNWFTKGPCLSKTY
jgi:hypothetical protein